eukprot:CAMPEP_0117451716 /NCGR_PEP_ID=MMETSP0759-20121206/9163_1 /TAXON_ID=63605 /ORGANISM="Percolomonas cosmopolitus, Strain WS" /LENGTH=134 /DNA_ID=CAMNT_0005244349 /DNA_START=77 /DNA_END=478 /DNA_ORIENTATION=-
MSYNDVLLKRSDESGLVSDTPLNGASSSFGWTHDSATGAASDFSSSPHAFPQHIETEISDSLAYRRLSCFTIHYLLYGNDLLITRLVQFFFSLYIIDEWKQFVLNLLAFSFIILSLKTTHWTHPLYIMQGIHVT